MMLDLQRDAARFIQHQHLRHDVERHALDVASEVGELAKEVLLATDYGRRSAQFRPDLANEIGDALYSLLALAEVCGVDAEAAIRGSSREYERRLEERGEAGRA
jgi:NTP pyrophosphatase (non-canonical NTP hydrolase)